MDKGGWVGNVRNSKKLKPNCSHPNARSLETCQILGRSTFCEERF